MVLNTEFPISSPMVFRRVIKTLQKQTGGFLPTLTIIKQYECVEKISRSNKRRNDENCETGICFYFN